MRAVQHKTEQVKRCCCRVAPVGHKAYRVFVGIDHPELYLVRLQIGLGDGVFVAGDKAGLLGFDLECQHGIKVGVRQWA